MLQRKLKSNTGASIAAALMLFLICAVLGGSILAAASVSGGRLSKRADMDRRYYGVTSAAELIADTLAADPVRIVRTETVVRVSTTSVDRTADAEGAVTFSEPLTVTDPPEYTYETAVGPAGSETRIGSVINAGSFLTRQTLRLCFGSADFDTEAAMLLPVPAAIPATSAESLPLTVSIPGTGGASPLNATINATARLKQDGTLVITVDDKPAGPAAGDYFALRMTLTPSINDTLTALPTETDTSTTSSASGDTISYTSITTVTTKRIRVTEVRWTVSSMEKLTQPEA